MVTINREAQGKKVSASSMNRIYFWIRGSGISPFFSATCKISENICSLFCVLAPRKVGLWSLIIVILRFGRPIAGLILDSVDIHQLGKVTRFFVGKVEGFFEATKARGKKYSQPSKATVHMASLRKALESTLAPSKSIPFRE